MSMRWNADKVADHVAKTKPMDWQNESDDDFQERFVRPVGEFGLVERHDDTSWPEDQWYPEFMPVRDVEVAKIQSSTQGEGVCINIVHWYITRPDELYDEDGWFGNDIPVLIERPDGTFTVRDGNHRTIAAMMRTSSTDAVHGTDDRSYREAVSKPTRRTSCRRPRTPPRSPSSPVRTGA
jgi:hypothetical protein